MGDHAITLTNEPRAGDAGHAASFDELYSEHHRKVLLAAYRVTGSMQDAEDVLQAVFLRLLNRGDRLRYAESTSAYLCKAAINGSLDLLRARKRTQTETLIEESIPSQTGAAESATQQAEQRRHLRQALQTLEQRPAEVFALRVFEDFSNAEIAQLLETSSNHVAVIYHKARTQLQNVLSELQEESR